MRNAELERGVLREDRALERAQRRRRVDPEALDTSCPRVIAVDLERVGLAARAVEREHLLAAQPLAQRVLRDEPLELAHERGVPPEHEVGVDPLLERREAKLFEPLDGRTGERLVREVGERRPAPELERLAEQRGGGRGVVARARALGLRRQALEAGEVEVLVADAEDVAGRPRLDRVGRAERAPELRHLALHLRDGRHGRPSGVEVVGELLDGHDAVRVQEQDRERRALPRPAEPDRAVLADDLERSQDAELEHRPRTVAGR